MCAVRLVHVVAMRVILSMADVTMPRFLASLGEEPSAGYELLDDALPKAESLGTQNVNRLNTLISAITGRGPPFARRPAKAAEVAR